MLFSKSGAKRAAAEFPPELDVDFYRSTQADLRWLSEQEARNHFEHNGRAEGRAGSPAGSRPAFLKLVPAGARVLEIGPAHWPSMKGPNVSYFDVQDAEGLRERARGLNEDPSGVPKTIHFVSPVGDLSIVEPAFDVVFSSHAIEHQPDLVQHLIEVERLLAPGGAYFVICPDKRYTFDHHIPESTVGDVVEAHMTRRKTHRIADVVDQFVLSCHNDPARHWGGDSPRLPIAIDQFRIAISKLEEAGGRYIDTHAWRISAPGFRHIMGLLREMNFSPLELKRLYDTPRGSNEFFAILARPENDQSRSASS